MEYSKLLQQIASLTKALVENGEADDIDEALALIVSDVKDALSNS